MRTALLMATATIALATAARADGPTRAVSGGIPADTYAQHLVDSALKAHPDVLVMAIHATPPKTKTNVIVASNIGRLGKAADADDLQVIASGQPKLEVNKAGDHFEVEAPLHDVEGQTIGAVGIVFPYKAGDDKAARASEALAIRDELGRRIAHAGNLLDRWPYDPAFNDRTFAQALVDRTLARHPEILILAVHATPPGQQTNVIMGSNIGRLGKAADEDDLRVIEKGETNREVNDTGRRFEAEMPLNDASGRRIGALGVVLRYHAGDDKDALVAHAQSIRDEMAREIVSPASLAAEAAPGLAVLASGHTDLPGYEGDFDHFAIAAPEGRLFLAGEDGGALEVFDLNTGALIKSLPGYDAPHSFIYLPETHEVVVVANTGSRVLDARTLVQTRTLALADGADSLGYDAARRRAYVVTGGKDVGMKTSALVEVDPYTGKTYGHTDFDGDHTEALAVESGGSRIFINQTDKNLLDVVDKHSHAILSRWTVAEAKQNAPIAYDEATRRLFVVTRAPGKLLVVNADTGATVQAFDAPSRVDQVLWEPANRRIFVCGGDGRLAVFEQQDADHYLPLAPVATPPASKTCVWSAEQNRLYLAASPGESKSTGGLVWFDFAPRKR